ncbi:alpha/beta fold hydrolase [Chitinimonas koreensis]|uniref:alpha/beta fold hydrolase n=1 Tax=Chitinimonas koreensis TaxID=356302 RepID=UPI0004049900|nr:alpha/beta fold hydrolase [Chitinimonas koreensis]QNM94706.1 alpha/beta fold hydrolase [Chitinimonas koreensis]
MPATDKLQLFLLPGLLNDARLWQHQVEGLADLADVTVGDLTATDTIPLLAAAALAQAPAGHYALAGLSMGGYVALEMMRQAPNRILGLALLDTSAKPDTAEASANRRKLIEQSGHDFGGVIASLLPKMFTPEGAEPGSENAQLFTEMAHKVGRDGFVRQQQAIMGRPDSREDLPRIACPTLVLCGRQDTLTPPELHAEMASMIPDATLEMVDGAGHLSPLEQPDAVTTALRAWLRRLQPAIYPLDGVQGVHGDSPARDLP